MEIASKHVRAMLLAVIILFSISCKKEAADATDYPVVISYLVAGEPVTVKVYRQKDLTDTSTYGEPVSGLQPTVSDGTNRVNLVESAEGVYTYADRHFVTAGKTYELAFNYLYNDVSASTVVPVKTSGYGISSTTIAVPGSTSTTPGDFTADSLLFTLKWNNPDSLYHVLVIKDTTSYLQPIQGWRFGPSSITVLPDKADYTDVYTRSINYYGGYQAVLYTVQKSYLDILESNSNTTSQKLSNPPGNILHGFGIFTGMQADTLYFSVVKK